MIENFKVRKEIFEDTTHEKCHFELILDNKEYQGYYDHGEVNSVPTSSQSKTTMK